MLSRLHSYNKLISVFLVLLLIFMMGLLFRKNKKSFPTYKLYATFSDVSGIVKGSNITISGFIIGSVKDIYLNDNLIPTIVLNIDKSYKLPVDTSASILSNGLFGKKYIEITLGGMDEFLKNNDTIAYTQSSINILDLVDKYLSSLKIEHKK